MKKSLIFIFVLAVILVTGGLFLAQQQTDQSKTENSVTPTSQSLYATFTSSRYILTFDYPVSMGQTTVTYVPESYKTEGLRFSHSDLYIQFPRFEGGDGGMISSEKITAKNGKECTLSVNRTGTNDAEYTIWISCDGGKLVNNLSTSVQFILSSIKTEAEMESNKTILKQIVATLSYDFSNVTF